MKIRISYDGTVQITRVETTNGTDLRLPDSRITDEVKDRLDQIINLLEPNGLGSLEGEVTPEIARLLHELRRLKEQHELKGDE